MTEYSFPKQPDGPLWDDTGQKWVKADNGVNWVMEGTEYGYFWLGLVIIKGPLTDMKPLEEGDDIGFDYEDYSDFPEGTAVATSTSVYQWRDGAWRNYNGFPYKKISDFADQKVDQEVRVVFIPRLEDGEDYVSSTK